MKHLDPTKKVYYINQLDEAIADYEDALRLIIIGYKALSNRFLFKLRPILRYKASKLLKEYDTMFNKYQEIKSMRFIPVNNNSN